MLEIPCRGERAGIDRVEADRQVEVAVRCGRRAHRSPVKVAVHHIFTTAEGQTGFVTVTRGASDNAPDLRRCAKALVSDVRVITFAT